MLAITVVNSLIFALVVLAAFYGVACVYAKQVVRPHFQKLFYYVTLFSLFGVVGEVFVNTAWAYVFGIPLWEYRLFPAHGGDITYFFPLVWGLLGFYTYFRDTVLLNGRQLRPLMAAMLLGAESMLIEILYNGSFFLVFDEFIFYYFPANLGPLSHFTCWQVIPFYMIVGFFTSNMIVIYNRLKYSRRTYILLAFFWFVTLTFVFF